MVGCLFIYFDEMFRQISISLVSYILKQTWGHAAVKQFRTARGEVRCDQIFAKIQLFFRYCVIAAASLLRSRSISKKNDSLWSRYLYAYNESKVKNSFEKSEFRLILSRSRKNEQKPSHFSKVFCQHRQKIVYQFHANQGLSTMKARERRKPFSNLCFAREVLLGFSRFL